MQGKSRRVQTCGLLLCGAIHRLIYCVLVCLCATAVYWAATPLIELFPSVATLPAIVVQTNSYIAGLIVVALLVLMLLAEFSAICYCMVLVRKRPRIVYLDEKESGIKGHFKIIGKRSKPVSIEPASKREICAFENMNIVRRKLNLPDEMDIDFLVEDADHLNAYTLGIEMPGGGRHIICATSRLIETMPPANTAAVMGHEVGHIRNRDSAMKLFMGCFRTFAVTILFAPLFVVYLVASILYWFVSLIPFFSVLARFFLFLLSMVAAFIQFVALIVMYPAHLYERYVSRQCEFMADAAAAHSVGPTSIGRALYRIGRHEDSGRTHPLRKVTDKMRVINATHPSLTDRVKAIRSRAYSIKADDFRTT